jgi:hypothetical protein
MVLLLPLTGCTTPSQWIADAQVDELCTKDGGIKVYETVTLPKERFNEWGQFTDIAFSKDEKSNYEYYRVGEDKFIQPYTSGHIGGLSIKQYHYWIYRRSDHKLLGESIVYSRGGGDVFMIDAPSGYTCPDKKVSIESQIFLKSSN